MMISENLKIVEDKITKKCSEAGRTREDITLVAISKTHPSPSVSEAFDAGILHFGENKAQELDEKAKQVEKNVIWHFVGHLQTNKVKHVVKTAEFIHSVDTEKLAAEINKRAGKLNKIQKIFLEINTSGEDSKFGLENNDSILKLAETCINSTNLELVGLMTMAPFTEDEGVIRKSFVNLRTIFDTLNNKGFGIKELSMGMTNDFEIALEEGATMLRIGSAIFGERNYK